MASRHGKQPGMHPHSFLHEAIKCVVEWQAHCQTLERGATMDRSLIGMNARFNYLTKQEVAPLQRMPA